MNFQTCCPRKAVPAAVPRSSFARAITGHGLPCAVAAHARHISEVQCYRRNCHGSRNRHVLTRAVAEAAPEWTLDQIAGLVFSFFMLASYFGAKYVDQYVATSQRKQVGVCLQCGGLYEGDSIPCPEQECPNRSTQPPAQPNQTPPA